MGNEQGAPATKKEVKQRLTQPILTTYNTLEDLQEALNKAGLESSNLIVGIDFTGSNNVTGEKTYGGKCLHEIIEGNPNPYMRVMDIMGRALAPYDDDGLIPVYGFGDKNIKGRGLFYLSKDKQPFKGMPAAIERYKQVAPTIKLAGPTSFVPLIAQAINIVKETKQYHILVIICDGQVNDVDLNRRAIEKASNYPLSIICVGVGDGPFGVMENFDDVIKKSKFDNFNFINYFKTCEGHVENPDVAFATVALHEIPEQYAQIKQLGYLDM